MYAGSFEWVELPDVARLNTVGVCFDGWLNVVFTETLLFLVVGLGLQILNIVW